MRILSTAGAGLRHGMGAVVEAGLVVAIAGVLVFGAAVVGRTDPAGATDVFARSVSGSISLAGVNGTYAARTTPSLGDTVTFDVSVSSNVNNPRVEVMCYQDGKVVYGETGSIGQARGDGTDSLGYNGFRLGGGGSIWKDVGGSASCKATLFYFGKKNGQQVFVPIAWDPFDATG
jgi:hypothetical protein